MVDYNAGYTIIGILRDPTHPERGVALGYGKDQPQPWVTWEFVERPTGAMDFYYGHYHFDDATAQADYIERIRKEWRV